MIKELKRKKVSMLDIFVIFIVFYNFHSNIIISIYNFIYINQFIQKLLISQFIHINSSINKHN